MRCKTYEIVLYGEYFRSITVGWRLHLDARFRERANETHAVYLSSCCQNRCRRDGTIDSGDGKSFGERLGPTGHSERARKQLRHTGGVSHSQHKSLFAKPKVQDSLPGGVSHSQHKRSKVGNSHRPETTYTRPTNTPMPIRKTPALNRPFQPAPLSPSWPKPQSCQCCSCGAITAARNRVGQPAFRRGVQAGDGPD